MDKIEFRSYSHSRKYSIYKDADAKVVILKRQQPQQHCKIVYEYQDASVKSACISDNGKLVCFLRTDGSATIEKFDQRDGPKELVEKIRFVDAGVSCALFAPGKNVLVLGTDDHKILVQHISRSRSKQQPPAVELVGHSGKISCLAMSLDGQRLASGSRDCTIRLWDMTRDEPRCLAIYTGHFSEIQSISFSPGNRHLVSAGLKDIRIWDMKNSSDPNCPPSFHDSCQSEPNPMFFSPTGKQLAILSRDREHLNVLEVLDAASGKQIFLQTGCLLSPTPAYSPDGKFLVLATEDGKKCVVQRIGDINKLWRELKLGCHPSAFVWSPRRNYLVILLNNGVVNVIDNENRNFTTTLPSKGIITDAVFSPCGQHLATQCNQEYCIVYSLASDGSWSVTHRLDYLDSEEISYRLVQFSENIHFLVVVQTIRLREEINIFGLNSREGKIFEANFSLHGKLECVAISSDDKYIACTDSTRMLQISQIHQIPAQDPTEQDGLVPSDDHIARTSDVDTSMTSDDHSTMAAHYSILYSGDPITVETDGHITSLNFMGSSSDPVSALKVGGAKLNLRKLCDRYAEDNRLQDDSIFLDRIGLSYDIRDGFIYFDSSPVVQIPPAIACRPLTFIVLKRGLKIAIQNAHGKPSVYVIRGLLTNKLPKQTHRFDPQHFPEDKDDYDGEMSPSSDEESKADEDEYLKSFDEDDFDSFDDGKLECYDASESSDSEDWEPGPRKSIPSNSGEQTSTASHTLGPRDVDITMEGT